MGLWRRNKKYNKATANEIKIFTNLHNCDKIYNVN